MQKRNVNGRIHTEPLCQRKGIEGTGAGYTSHLEGGRNDMLGRKV